MSTIANNFLNQNWVLDLGKISKNDSQNVKKMKWRVSVNSVGNRQALKKVVVQHDDQLKLKKRFPTSVNLRCTIYTQLGRFAIRRGHHCALILGR